MINTGPGTGYMLNKTYKLPVTSYIPVSGILWNSFADYKNKPLGSDKKKKMPGTEKRPLPVQSAYCVQLFGYGDRKYKL